MTATEIGLLMTIISAVFLALVVISDKLTLGEFYHDEPESAWFVSSVLGSLLGIGATAIAWMLVGENSWSSMLLLAQGDLIALSWLMIASGLLVSLTLRSYFHCFSGSVSSLVALALAATPVFVFAGEHFLYGTSMEVVKIAGLVIVVLGLSLFNLTDVEQEETGKTNLVHLFGLIVFGSGYLLLVDFTLPLVEAALHVDETQASLAAMPWYWLGFAVGAVNIARPKVRSFLPKIHLHPKFIVLILSLETIAAGFYFFEFFGLASLDVTLVALITGAHVIIVWISDLIIRRKYHKAVREGRGTVHILFFSIKTKKLGEYDLPMRTVFVQAIAIMLVIAGLATWLL